MANFIYKGFNENGITVSGVISALSKEEAISALMAQEIDIISLKKESNSKSYQVALNQKDMISFFIHIAEMAKAGMSTMQSLELLSDLSDGKRLSKISKALKDKIYSGMNLSNAMESLGCFGDMFPNLIFVAEKTNSVYKVGIMIVDYIKWTAHMKQNIRAAILKPIMSLVLILLMITGMSVFVLPKLLATLSEFNNNSALPKSTVAFVKFSDFIRNRWWTIPIIIILFYLINKIPRLFKITKAEIFIDKLKLKIPLFGKLLLKIEMARLSSFMCILIHAGYKANEAIMLSHRIIGNKFIKKVITNIGFMISAGESMHSAFSKFPIFPKFFISMIGIGEVVNDIEGTITNIKEAYDKEVDTTAEFIISSVKPMITVMTGVIVGWMGTAVFGPMYNSLIGLSGGIK